MTKHLKEWEDDPTYITELMKLGDTLLGLHNIRKEMSRIGMPDEQINDLIAGILETLNGKED